MLKKLKGRLRHALEIRQVQASIAAASSRPAPAELVQARAGTAVWRVKLPGRDDQYMKATGSDTEDLYVVHVDAEAFYLGMVRATTSLRTSRYGDSCMAREDMHLDYKFEHAVAGFGSSSRSPVPLAKPAIGRDVKGKLTVRFTDGITRTYWLLANGCKCFPVEVRGAEEAEFLASHAGVGLISFLELFGPATAA